MKPYPSVSKQRLMFPYNISCARDICLGHAFVRQDRLAIVNGDFCFAAAARMNMRRWVIVDKHHVP